MCKGEPLIILQLVRVERVRFTLFLKIFTSSHSPTKKSSGVLKECSSTPNGVNGGLPDDCELITGNLYVDGASNANITTKLQYVKEVYGRVYIRSTTLSNLTIPLLEKVYASEPTASTSK